MPLPDFVLSNPPSLSEQLKLRTEQLRARILRANYNTQFAQTAPELTQFRRATTGLVDGMDNDILSKSFCKTVPFTTYDSYAPFTARFFEKPCNASAIVDLLAPGLPDFLVLSSSTSGGLAKTFPQYKCTLKIRSSGTGSWVISDPLRRRTKAYIWYLVCKRMEFENEDGSSTTIHLTGGSIVGQRMRVLHLVPEEDEEKMGTLILDHAAPYAAAFIKEWRSFLLIHALFSFGSKSIETMDMLLINTFVDMMRCLDTEFDVVVDCIASGTIPDLDGIAEVRHHLEANFFPDPERAEELRRLGRPSSRPGWCNHAWPNLRSVTAVASGCFGSSLPLARWFLGPNTDILAHGYGASEAYIGPPYDPLEVNQYKPSSDIAFEFLDIRKTDSISSLAQPWEVESGRRYELVLTTSNGLWRYRLGDVVEICGFDPTDGVPIMQFVERRNVAIRLQLIALSEAELQAAVSSVQINIVNWTTMIDDRRIPDTIGFFVELSGDQVSDLALAPQRALDHFLQHPMIDWALSEDKFRKPTIRIVRPGTFRDFMQLKLDEGCNNVGQIKVPVVLPKASYVTWFLSQVVQEL